MSSFVLQITVHVYLESYNIFADSMFDQSGRHQSRTQEVTAGNFFCWIYFSLLYVSLYCQHCQLYVIKEKLEWIVQYNPTAQANSTGVLENRSFVKTLGKPFFF